MQLFAATIEIPAKYDQRDHVHIPDALTHQLVDTVQIVYYWQKIWGDKQSQYGDTQQVCRSISKSQISRQLRHAVVTSQTVIFLS